MDDYAQWPRNKVKQESALTHTIQINDLHNREKKVSVLKRRALEISLLERLFTDR